MSMISEMKAERGGESEDSRGGRRCMESRRVWTLKKKGSMEFEGGEEDGSGR